MTTQFFILIDTVTKTETSNLILSNHGCHGTYCRRRMLTQILSLNETLAEVHARVALWCVCEGKINSGEAHV